MPREIPEKGRAFRMEGDAGDLSGLRPEQDVGVPIRALNVSEKLKEEEADQVEMTVNAT